MTTDEKPASPRRRAVAWLAVTVVLGTWNGLATSYASPFHMVHTSDTTQYQLLARNRLRGHNEVGDGAHTVRTEGLHPAWRPGLVWLEEALAKPFGSVRAAAAAASALGTTLLELALIALAARVYGAAAAMMTLAALLLPTPVGGCFLLMAVGQGPEPWAAAGVVAGLAGVAEAVRRRSWGWAVAGGLVAGFGEWFRTGNLPLFGVPCAAYGLAALWRRDWRGLALPVAAGVAFLAVAAVGDRQVPSDVNKSVANLWCRILEYEGDKIPNVEGSRVTLHLEGMKIVPDTAEDYYDYLVSRSRGMSTARFAADHAGRVAAVYWNGLRDIAAGGGSGLRQLVGDGVFLCFIAQVLFSLTGRSLAPTDSLAFASGALAYYFGPIALLQGNGPTHYLFVALPLFLLVAAAGLLHLWTSLKAAVARRRPELAVRLAHARVFLLVLVFAPLGCLGLSFYLGTLNILRADCEQARHEQAALDALGLDGKRVCCRNMSWFVDRNVQTVFLPYAQVPELARYAHEQNADGILVWENERQPMLRVMPYPSHEEFEERMREQFGPPKQSGVWRWYAVR